MTESKVQKKMDKEMFEQIKQMENQDNEAGKKDGGPKDKSTEIRRIEDVRINIKEEDNPSPSIASEERFIDDQHIKRMKSQNNER